MHWLTLLWPLVAVLAIEFDVVRDLDANNTLSLLSGDANLFWGPYRLGNYFGIRPRTPWLLMLGLLWYSVDGYDGIANLRHAFEQGDASIRKANWIQYDPRLGGRQVIEDQLTHHTILIDFVKLEDGLSWAVLATATPHKGFELSKLAMVWYLGLEGSTKEGLSGYLNFKDLQDHAVHLDGISEELGLFDLLVYRQGRAPAVALDHGITGFDCEGLKHLLLHVPDGQVWRSHEIFGTLVQESVEQLVAQLATAQEQVPAHQLYVMRNLHDYEGNVHFIQGTFEGMGRLQVFYNAGLTPEHQRLGPESFGEAVKKTLTEVTKKWTSAFELQPPFVGRPYHEFAHECISGLLGGLSYFYGDHLVDRETKIDDLDDVEAAAAHKLAEGKFEGPHELFTLVPLRPFFPRGFYWDEGFHLLPLLNYDPELVVEILDSWFNLIDDDGWIAREQILGPEARLRVPEQFQVQSPEIVNPPTLMLAYVYLLELLEAGQLEDGPKIDLESVYPKLKKHFEFIRLTQIGMKDEFERPGQGYRWRGRTLTHCLALGLDDYPRPQPADVAELHVDLLSWVGVMARSLKLMAHRLGHEVDQEYFGEIEDNVTHDLGVLHWSDEHGCYCDTTLDEDEDDELVCHQGYISIFPFLTKFVPTDDEKKIGAIVDAIRDPERLWTPYGIRSLSKLDPYYATGENYWRSPIWVQMNYLVLDGLRHYYPHVELPKLKKKMARTYASLRENVVGNVYQQWQKTGFVWEQYDDTTGEHKGAKNFLGWTSSVVMMMEMPQKLT